MEKALTQQDQRQYLDPVSLGSLIVSVAALAWTIANDLRSRRQAPSVEQVARQVRIELTVTGHLANAETLDKIVNVVIAETLKLDQPEPGGKAGKPASTSAADAQ
ncbi:hypothetical protein ACFQ1L_31665 [Phytohabitans flavus]|uniref:hypothetical protein n=1 Tax=Phytohabitans flavus TaxID=1076124 RepID=UPI003635DEE0